MPPLPVQPQWGLAFPCIEDTDILLAEEEFVNRKVFFAYFLMPTTVVKASLSFFFTELLSASPTDWQGGRRGKLPTRAAEAEAKWYVHVCMAAERVSSKPWVRSVLGQCLETGSQKEEVVKTQKIREVQSSAQS